MEIEWWKFCILTFLAYFGFFHTNPHMHAITMHPIAPADGKPIALLPTTDNNPPKNINPKRKIFENFYMNNKWLFHQTYISLYINMSKNETHGKKKKKI